LLTSGSYIWIVALSGLVDEQSVLS
ncbi:hypothetical protein lerEdw1_017072, partial [Lerista edwardsae]